MNKALHPRDDKQFICVKKKKGGIEDSVGTTIQGLKEKTK